MAGWTANIWLCNRQTISDASSRLGVSLPQNGFFVIPKILVMTFEQVCNDRIKVGTRWDIDRDQMILLEQLCRTAQAFKHLSKRGRIGTLIPNHPNKRVRRRLYYTRVAQLAIDMRPFHNISKRCRWRK